MAILQRNSVLVVLVVLATVYSAARAEPCPSVTSYMSCREPVTKPNVNPDAACCDEIAAVLKQANGAQCLCDAMTGPAATTFKVIKEEAINLPKKCQALFGLQYIHGYICKGVTIP